MIKNVDVSVFLADKQEWDDLPIPVESNVTGELRWKRFMNIVFFEPKVYREEDSVHIKLEMYTGDDYSVRI